MVMLRCVNTAFDVCHADFLAVFSPVWHCIRTACAIGFMSVYATVIRGVMT